MRQREPRKHDPGYLSWLRKRQCVACYRRPPCDAAHIRAASPERGKPYPGMGAKPDDKWALPLCRSCHTAQHDFGSEVAWWSLAGIDPFNLAKELYLEYGGHGGSVKPPRKIKPRKPVGQRTKIKGRTTWPKRSFQ